MGKLESLGPCHVGVFSWAVTGEDHDIIPVETQREWSAVLTHDKNNDCVMAKGIITASNDDAVLNAFLSAADSLETIPLILEFDDRDISADFYVRATDLGGEFHIQVWSVEAFSITGRSQRH